MIHRIFNSDKEIRSIVKTGDRYIIVTSVKKDSPIGEYWLTAAVEKIEGRYTAISEVKSVSCELAKTEHRRMCEKWERG